ncbi:MAG: sulfatase-like hydrolase/transferase, partial [Verrucomicrobiae bacterium]|nr:sulfatase-like hydrolase/transferase [Verrucomicrobiae bacterium]
MTTRLSILALLGCGLAHAQTPLFSDNFNRANGAINGSADGITNQTGTDLTAGAYGIPYADPSPLSPDGDAGNGGGIDISGNEMRLAVGSGTSNAFVSHNFINASILSESGFTVTVDITGANQNTTGQGGGFAIGMTEAEALETGDALNGSNNPPAATKMTEAFGATGDVTSDFWLVLRANGTLAWGLRGADPTVNTVSVGSKTGTISATFTHFSDFNAGTSVDYEVFYNGASQGTGSFTWGNTGANFIGLDARDGTAVSFDNLEIATVDSSGPPVPSASLAVTPTNVSISSTSETVTLDWSASDLPAGTTYTITSVPPVTFPSGGDSGPAGPGSASGSVEATVDGTAGTTTFTIGFSDATPAVIASATASVVPKRPNVILIMTDDMGVSDFGCYGSEIHTPRIDSLAANGIRFRNFYNTARCSTTRCALLSGLYTHQGATNPGASLPPLDDDNNVTIAELLSTTGYRRYMTGKWHVGTSNDLSPIGRGFQHIFGQTSGGNFPHNQVSGGNHDSFWNASNFGFYSENGEVAAINYAAEYPGEPFHQTTFIGEYALRFIDHHLSRNDGAPFFLYMPFNAVHWDINAPNDMADRYTDVADLTPDGLTSNNGADGGDYYHYEVGWNQTRADRFARQVTVGFRDPAWVLSPKKYAINSNGFNGTNDPNAPLELIPDWENVDPGNATVADRQNDLARRMALYAAMLEMVDDNIGKVVDKLSAESLLEETMIIILADNGGNYEGGLYGRTNGTINANPVTGTTNLRNMGQPGAPDLHVGGGWANVNNTPFRLFKHFQHEGGIRTPCIIHYPDGITSPGRWVNERGHLIDIMATISDVTGTPFPATFTDLDENNSGNNTVRTLLPLEGESLAPLFDPATEGDFPSGRPLGFEHEKNRAWIKNDMKLVTKNCNFLDGSSPAHELELYDLTVDPTELNNLATSNTALLAQYIDEWNAWANRVGVPSDRLLAGISPTVSLVASPAAVPTNEAANDITLTWNAAFVPAGGTYRITADTPVGFPGGDDTGSAASGNGEVHALMDGLLGDTTFTIEILDGATVVTSDTATVQTVAPETDPAALAGDLFVDTFNRPD